MQEIYYLKLGNLYVERLEIDGNYTHIGFASDVAVATEFSLKEVGVAKSIIEVCLGVNIEKEIK